MNIPALGNLNPHPDFPDEWLVSDPLEIPFLEGAKLTFTLMGLEETDEQDVNDAVTAFLSLGRKDRDQAAPYLLMDYRRMLELVDAEDLGLEGEIESEDEVWALIHPQQIYVSRRHRRNKEIYVWIAAECDWEPEHGLQVVFRKGAFLSRVSDQDGHVAYADARNLPKDQDRIP